MAKVAAAAYFWRRVQPADHWRDVAEVALTAHFRIFLQPAYRWRRVVSVASRVDVWGELRSADKWG